MICFACNILQSQTAGEHLFMEYSLGVLNGGRYLQKPRGVEGGGVGVLQWWSIKRATSSHPFLYESPWQWCQTARTESWEERRSEVPFFVLFFFRFFFSKDQTFSMSRSRIYPINTAINGIFENYYGPPVISQPGISFGRLATAQKPQFRCKWKKDKSEMNLL